MNTHVGTDCEQDIATQQFKNLAAEKGATLPFPACGFYVKRTGGCGVMTCQFECSPTRSVGIHVGLGSHFLNAFQLILRLTLKD